jgi:hypothetical protein
MPYVITTTTRRPIMIRSDVDHPRYRESYCAAVTLNDAAERVYDILDDALSAARTGAVVRIDPSTVKASDAFALPDTGGTIGPLPDGTSVTVEPASAEQLVAYAGMIVRKGLFSDAEAVEIFNETRGAA